MQRRALFSVINLGVAAAALVVFFLFPRYAGYALYAFLGWFVVGLSTVWLARGSSPAGVPSAATPSPAGAGAGTSSTAPARPTASPSPEPPQVGFCIYCAADLPTGADRCGACGHPRARLA